MGVAKAGGNTIVKTKAAPAVNGAFCLRVDHGSGRKVGINGRAAVDNRQQWQQQLDNNQLKMTVTSIGVDSRGGSGEQQRSTAISSKMPMANTIIAMPPTPLLSTSAGGSGQAAARAARE
jgi:hypothetical protein